MLDEGLSLPNTVLQSFLLPLLANTLTFPPRPIRYILPPLTQYIHRNEHIKRIIDPPLNIILFLLIIKLRLVIHNLLDQNRSHLLVGCLPELFDDAICFPGEFTETGLLGFWAAFFARCRWVVSGGIKTAELFIQG